MRKIWNKRKDSLLRQEYPCGDLAELSERLGVTRLALKARARRLGIYRRKPNPWTESQLDYLREHYADMRGADIAQELGRSFGGVIEMAARLGLRKSREFLRECGRRSAESEASKAHRFVKGQEPHNKGKRIEQFMSAEGIRRSSATRFKKGCSPANIKPIGYERTGRDGYVYIKVCMGERMVLKHRYVWEGAYGVIPEGYSIAFRDGNRQNCSLDNLYLISKEDLARKILESETPECRAARIAKAQETRNKSIRRDRVRLHWGFEPIGKLIKRW